MIRLRTLVVASLFGCVPTIAMATSLGSVTLSPDPPIEFAPFSVLIGIYYNWSCESVISTGPPTAGPDFVNIDCFAGCGVNCSMCQPQPPTSFTEVEVPVTPLYQGDYTLTVNLLGEVYTDQFTVVPEPPAVELLDGKLVAAGSPSLHNGTDTVRLEDGRLDSVGGRVFVVPEAGALWQLGSGVGLLVLLARRRSRLRRRTPW
jgi:hypothetical protein